MLLAYVGPGPGFAVQAPLLLIVFGVLAALLALLTLPIRALFRKRLPRGKSKARRAVILGLDGLEPTRVDRLRESGQLPNFCQLAKSGSYQTLRTTCPPLSPVAWSTFSTGVQPGKHGIFGFLHRGSGYQPALAFSRVDQGHAYLGPLRLPWKVGRPRFLRKSRSFWSVLGDHGVFSHILRVPVTWPAEPFHGLLLSAMGAPDLRGTQGTYTLFGKADPGLEHGDFVPLIDGNAEIPGPGKSRPRLRLKGSLLKVGGRELVLEVNRHSPWVELRFGRVRGLARFVLREDGSLYMTPVQIDPAKPSLPVSHPALYSAALAKVFGPFATCGLAEDMGAREDGVLTEEAFLEQAYDIHQERERQFFHALERTSEGVCAVVFDGTDRIQHMVSEEGKLDELYRRMDQLLGKTLEVTGPDDLVMVLSDHGFKPLHRLFDVNAWLHREGYLAHDDERIDWSNTRAYALGLCGISLNLKGREPDGVVEAEQAAELCRRLKAALESLEDGRDRPLAEVFVSGDHYQGPYVEKAPDLVLGYRPGYGVLKDAARGKVGRKVFLDNDSAWGADHGFHPDLVPGILFCNRPLREGAGLADIAPTMMELFGVEPPGYLEGKSLLC